MSTKAKELDAQGQVGLSDPRSAAATDPEHSVQFTLGPWSLDPEGYGIVLDTHGDPIQTAGPYAVTANGPEAYANAQLIAAAPELREAMKNIVAIIDAAGLIHLSNGVQLGATSWYVKASDRLDYARAILAKAEGREAKS